MMERQDDVYLTGQADLPIISAKHIQKLLLSRIEPREAERFQEVSWQKLGSRSRWGIAWGTNGIKSFLVRPFEVHESKALRPKHPNPQNSSPLCPDANYAARKRLLSDSLE